MKKGLFALLPACSPLTSAQWQQVYLAEHEIHEVYPLLIASNPYNFGINDSYKHSMQLTVQHLQYIIDNDNIVNGTCPAGKAAWYNAATDKIHMCEWKDNIAGILMHEVGHEYWAKKHQGNDWDTVYETKDFPYLNGNMTEYANKVIVRAKSLKKAKILGDNYCIYHPHIIDTQARFLVEITDENNWINKNNVEYVAWLQNAGMLHPCD